MCPRRVLRVAVSGLAFFASQGLAQTTTRVSVDSAGNQAAVGTNAYPSISADGRWIAFMSEATNLVSGDTNRHSDVFLHDRVDHTTTRIGLGVNGAQPNGDCIVVEGHESGPAISATGRYVAFNSRANNLVPNGGPVLSDVFVWDRDTATTVRVSVTSSGNAGDGVSYHPAVSADGRFVAFSSDSNNLVAGDTNRLTDVFVRDRDLDGNGIFDELGGCETRRVSVSSSGAEGTRWSGDGPCYRIDISADGRFVSFCSDAPNLVPGDANNQTDVFVHDLSTGMTERVSVDSAGAESKRLNSSH